METASSMQTTTAMRRKGRPKRTAAPMTTAMASTCPNYRTTGIGADEFRCSICTDWCANGYVKGSRKVWDCYDGEEMRSEKMAGRREAAFNACCARFGGERDGTNNEPCQP